MISEICEDLPLEFSAILKYVRELQFEDCPDYGYMKKLLKNVLKTEGIEDDGVMDWNKKKVIQIEKDLSDSDSEWNLPAAKKEVPVES